MYIIPQLSRNVKGGIVELSPVNVSWIQNESLLEVIDLGRVSTPGQVAGVSLDSQASDGIAFAKKHCLKYAPPLRFEGVKVTNRIPGWMVAVIQEEVINRRRVLILSAEDRLPLESLVGRIRGTLYVCCLSPSGKGWHKRRCHAFKKQDQT